MGTGGTSPSLPPVGGLRGSSTLFLSPFGYSVQVDHNPFGLHPDNCTNRIQYVTFTIDLIVSLNVCISALIRVCYIKRLNQALDRLVSTTCMCYHTSSVDLSPGSPPGVLLLADGSLILEVGFTLRCFQRLSRPYFASLLCRWHDNSCTSGMSIPVLSY